MYYLDDAWLITRFSNYSLLGNWRVIRRHIHFQVTKSLPFGYNLLERGPVFTSTSHYLVF